ncbi:HAD-superfamily hydrolase, subfamily IA, variant 3 [Bibersteinia trehalosi USDA-ARS-USMARC-189]|uniref:HAD-superfamily hydrolase, subfamily IA, variant 3 n=1 Tax=Bibersteinia trehalosi USDA-ARS-USMARC-189 TaxID=1263831 RepID=A0ABM5PE93_BIBTR|nr:hexitol phosphatase HxpB [Bibersteinia trehalosi]AGH38056.1 HAD-superfamily hydrolase, subfamily IA, variant 3 [Bibersteinia trehalosi USDA-ARS-USMARC-192]AHG84455.1 HAD-superfamily hydrolase, subfamily IA, variant 3 [Bibersteinia trehalosi USDA-ARS-USMARC-189]
MQIKAVIFDMDGVIIDSEPMWAEAQIKTLHALGQQITEQDCEHLTRGKRIDQIAHIWIERYQLNANAEEVANQILRYAYEAILAQGCAMEGLYPLLDLLQKKNIPLALATSSAPMIIEAVFNKLNLWDYFRVQCSANDEAYGKPHPAVYLTAVQKLNVNINDCLVIEDSVTGLIAAKAAGLQTVIVNPNYADPRFSLADKRVDSLSKLMATFSY